MIRTAKQIADEKGYKSAVMTFYPHPSVVLGKRKRMRSILHQCVIKKNSREFRIDILYVVKFDESFAGLLPQQFVDDYIIGLNVKHVVAGFDYSYGRLEKERWRLYHFMQEGVYTDCD